ncbi:hypothetical protein PYK79_48410 [Streptomyces sp. ID05-04B]|uniref:hypothetical protein n=1 Tax=Streptomyces sp. ID05-04B TaxID=3028661 RepID=UPI0029C33603|nr:hypothetical protein [Streptomyces sp. ID05-04B]MDX5569527.1 hypothetical protein [Streptomyces sp. ID05-04B]
MTRTLAAARTCRLAALAFLTAAGWLAATGWPWWLVAVTAWPTPSLLYLDAMSRRAHHRHHTRQPDHDPRNSR